MLADVVSLRCSTSEPALTFASSPCIPPSFALLVASSQLSVVLRASSQGSLAVVSRACTVLCRRSRCTTILRRCRLGPLVGRRRVASRISAACAWHCLAAIVAPAVPRTCVRPSEAVKGARAGRRRSLNKRANSNLLFARRQRTSLQLLQSYKHSHSDAHTHTPPDKPRTPRTCRRPSPPPLPPTRALAHLVHARRVHTPQHYVSRNQSTSLASKGTRDDDRAKEGIVPHRSTASPPVSRRRSRARWMLAMDAGIDARDQAWPGRLWRTGRARCAVRAETGVLRVSVSRKTASRGMARSRDVTGALEEGLRRACSRSIGAGFDATCSRSGGSGERGWLGRMGSDVTAGRGGLRGGRGPTSAVEGAGELAY